ncbi:hypothetical protein RO3G_14038 [Rhizopus delemar RA 99-880]|uniref:Uncharacterized protein n=1 Tax=Rhizopus delemar (strain RA 99-880 / ATCC MYA-4621 / FGSC 9543 / NRRL 43880) TaxID=246409 RepID=I1CLJ7_RHIO9|nr:hypothetical protein RO3G_14038 [Rhizopus delemar RA 99-880]|eukprot:EIE89327.1 hypothetical protein RO3G_14038 [Rhizopus delemar RA 99-880]
MLNVFKTVVSVPLLNVNLSSSSFSTVWLSVVPVMVSSVSLWNLVPRVVKSLSLVRFVLPVPRP